MRFCTTCGRNFEGELPECPHDGTPLFDMGAPNKEPLLAGASDPWREGSEAEVDPPEPQVDETKASAELEVKSPDVSAEGFGIKSDATPTHGDADDAEVSKVSDTIDGSSDNLESVLFDSSDESKVDAGDEDSLVDDVSREVKIKQKEEVILDDALAPIEAGKIPKSSGGSKLIPIILVLVLLGAAGFYFVGGGKEMLSPPDDVPVVTKEVPKTIVKKEIDAVGEPVDIEEKVVEDTKLADTENPPATEEVIPEPVKEEPVAKVKKRKKRVKKKVKKKKSYDPEEMLRRELEAMNK